MARREFTLIGFNQSKHTRNSLGMRTLTRLFGNDGYATYLTICELICGTPGARLSLSSEGQIEIAAEACHISDQKTLLEIVSACVAHGFFSKDAWESERVIESAEILEEYAVESKVFSARRGRSEQNYGRHRDAIYRRDGGQCVYCGSTEKLSLDHVTPFSRGGSDHHENLATCCMSCNLSKGARTPEEWKGRSS